MSTEEWRGRQEETIEIKRSIVIDVSPAVVFKAITDPNELTNWFPDQAILEPKVGGKMKFGFYKKFEKREPGSWPRQGLFPRRDYYRIYSK